MKRNFLLCGFTGWCLEVFWTGLHSLFSGHFDMTGHSSLLMFPIYGCASVIAPVSVRLRKTPTILRGLLYSTGIMCIEFISGAFLKYLRICPWDYSHSPFHIRGLIRMDYFPLWFLVGLFYEKILTRYGSKNTVKWT